MSVTKLKCLFERLTKAGWGDAVLRCNGVNLGELRELRIIPLDGGLAVELVTEEGESDNV